jgi:DNA-binding HxlR family transcriptional regulator
MQADAIGDRPCSVARTLSIIGERWTLLIIRDCFYGVAQFNQFQHRLGLPRHVLSNRLAKLVEAGILERHLYHTRPKRYEYRLSPKGKELYPILMTMVSWGDKWVSNELGAPMEYIHQPCGHSMHGIVHCSECGEEIHADSVSPRRGPGFNEPLRSNTF